MILLFHKETTLIACTHVKVIIGGITHPHRAITRCAPELAAQILMGQQRAASASSTVAPLVRHKGRTGACLQVSHSLHLYPLDSLVRPLVRDASSFSAIPTDIVEKDSGAWPLQTGFLRGWFQVALLLLLVNVDRSMGH